MESLLHSLSYTHILRLFKVLLAFLMVLSSLLAIKDVIFMLHFNFAVNRPGWKKSFCNSDKKKMCARQHK